METRYEYWKTDETALTVPESADIARPCESAKKKKTGGQAGPSVRRIKLAICAALFAASLCIRLVAPDAAGKLDAKLLTLIDGGWDYKTAIAQVGAFTAQNGMTAVSALLNGDGGSARAFAHGTASEKARGELSGALPPMAAEPAPEKAEEPEAPAAEPEPEKTAVEAFMESQSAYAELGVPEEVSFEMPELGIECLSPVSGAVTDNFGWREHPIEKQVKFHYGMDIGAEEGAEISAFADGTVYAVGDSASLGLYIIIDHENGVRTQYAHCSEITASAGDTVAAGQKIALVGHTGEATGPHLHLTLTKDGVYLNPGYYVSTEAE